MGQNKEIWPQIDRVALIETIPKEMHLLPRTLDRFEGSRYFLASAPSIEKEGINNWTQKTILWHAWAAIASLPSPSKSDVIAKDITEINQLEKWNHSNVRKNIYQDPLVSTFLELRNYNVHFKITNMENRNFNSIIVRDGNQEEIDFGISLFIQAVDFDELRKTRNIQSGLSNITEQMVNWFNRQSQKWPIHYLLGEARERYMAYLATFVQSTR